MRTSDEEREEVEAGDVATAEGPGESGWAGEDETSASEKAVRGYSVIRGGWGGSGAVWRESSAGMGFTVFCAELSGATVELYLELEDRSSEEEVEEHTGQRQECSRGRERMRATERAEQRWCTQHWQAAHCTDQPLYVTPCAQTEQG